MIYTTKPEDKFKCILLQICEYHQIELEIYEFELDKT